MRFIQRALSLFLLLSLLAAVPCGAEAAFTEQDAMDSAESTYLLLTNGEYDAVLDMFDDSVKAMVTVDILAAGYASQISPAGAFEAIEESGAMLSNNTYTVQLLARHADGQILLVCVFSMEGKLVGLNFQNLSNTEPVADPLPLALPEGAQEIEVTLHKGTEKELTGALVLPEGAGADTAIVIMAHGSGTSDMDETIGPNKPFRDIAYGLAERGIASLRYDKLHFVHPELATADLTVDDEYTDTVLEALATARAQADLGPAYLLGHSQGGMLTPYLMQKSEGGFAGGIILAGTPRQLWEVMYDQNVAILEGLPEAEMSTSLAMLDAEIKKLAALDTMDANELLQTNVFGMPGPYIAHMLRIDTLALAHENNAPLLILQGEEDFQISYAVDFAAWQEGLADMGDIVTFKHYPGLSHLFMPAEGSINDAVQAYATPALVDTAVISDIADWIEAQ